MSRIAPTSTISWSDPALRKFALNEAQALFQGNFSRYIQHLVRERRKSLETGTNKSRPFVLDLERDLINGGWQYTVPEEGADFILRDAPVGVWALTSLYEGLEIRLTQQLTQGVLKDGLSAVVLVYPDSLPKRDIDRIQAVAEAFSLIPLYPTPRSRLAQALSSISGLQ